MLQRLWADESGAILSAELILLMTILVIGGIVGLKTLQDALLTEMADLAAAIAAIDPSFSFTGAQATDINGVVVAATPGSRFQRPVPPGNTQGTPTFGVTVAATLPASEGGVLVP